MQRARVALEVVSPPAPALEVADDVFAEAVVELDFDAIFRRYAPYVAAIAHRLLGRDADVDDTVQEVFLVAVRGLASVRDPSAVKSWLARIAVRAARRRLQVRRLRTYLGMDDPSGYDTLADGQASPEQRALLARVYRVLDGLPADQRIAWTLRHIEGEQLDSVAVLAGCSLATAKRRISAASAALEEAFSDG
jgi:RNA polymerase sigma-70 factor (ECF subfamily)